MPNVLQSHLLASHNILLPVYCQENLVPSVAASKKRTLVPSTAASKKGGATLKRKKEKEKRVRKRKPRKGLPGLKVKEEVQWMAATAPTNKKQSDAQNFEHLEKEDGVMPVECVLAVDPPAASEAACSGDSAMVFSDSPSETCLFTCGICHKHVSSLRRHVVPNHQISSKQYRAIYPEVFERKTYHRWVHFLYFFFLNNTVASFLDKSL